MYLGDLQCIARRKTGRGSGAPLQAKFVVCAGRFQGAWGGVHAPGDTRMQRYTFATFLVDDANREAFELCRDVADLRWEGTPALALVGERGYGKTHLLYAIVNHVRTTTSDTGVAYVRGGDFPREVRDLVANPGPVQRARSAILIVDDVDKFRSAGDVLERLVRLFLDHGHQVVFASSTPVAELTHLPEGLREMLRSAHAVTILPDAKAVPGDSIIDKMEDRAAVITRQEARIAELEATLRADDAGDTPRAEGPSATTGEVQSLTHELRERLDDAQDEIEHLRGENALLNVSKREQDTIRSRIRELEDLQHTTGDESAWSEERTGSRPESDAARAKAKEMLVRADELMETVANESIVQGKESETEASLIRERDDALAELEEVRADLEIANQREAEIRDTISQAQDEIGRLKKAAVEVQMARDPSHDAFSEPEAEDVQFVAEIEAARAECDRLRGAIVRARAERETIKAQLRRTVEELNRYTSDQEHQKHEHIELYEAAERRIANFQEQVENLKSELEETRRTNGVITAELQTLHAQLTESLEPEGSNIADFAPRVNEAGTFEKAEVKPSTEDSTPPEVPLSDPSEDDTAAKSILLGGPVVAKSAPVPSAEDPAPPRHGFQVQPPHNLHEVEFPRAAAVGEGDPPFAQGTRPDFGDSVQSDAAPLNTSALHHVEELRDELDPAVPPSDAAAQSDEPSSDSE